MQSPRNLRSSAFSYIPTHASGPARLPKATLNKVHYLWESVSEDLERAAGENVGLGWKRTCHDATVWLL